jgi:hypothetical protein
LALEAFAEHQNKVSIERHEAKGDEEFEDGANQEQK